MLTFQRKKGREFMIILLSKILTILGMILLAMALLIGVLFLLIMVIGMVQEGFINKWKKGRK